MQAQAPRPEQPTPEQERNAMRAYLQRSEVRLSTMHRVAVGFISGAGLLFLFPVFLKDSILAILREYVTYSINPPAQLGQAGQVANIIGYLLLLFPFALSVGIPAVALVLLVRDTVRFYFLSHAPGFPEDSINPRFVLTGVAFSPDESPQIKSQILMQQYGTDLINFVLPYNERRAAAFSELIDKDHMIVPKTRKLPKLMQDGIVESNDHKPPAALQEDDAVLVHDSEADDTEDTPRNARQRTVKDIDRFNAALGLAGFIERPLREEVAKQEVSLVRHSLRLRRLVFRYFQALMILLWTALVTFLMLPFIQERTRFPFLIVVAIGYAIWSIFAPLAVQLPFSWVTSYAGPEQRRRGGHWVRQSDGVQRFEMLVRRICYISIAATICALAIELWLRSV
jgi:hypothetical protein